MPQRRAVRCCSRLSKPVSSNLVSRCALPIDPGTFVFRHAAKPGRVRRSRFFFLLVLLLLLLLILFLLLLPSPLLFPAFFQPVKVWIAAASRISLDQRYFLHVRRQRRRVNLLNLVLFFFIIFIFCFPLVLLSFFFVFFSNLPLLLLHLLLFLPLLFLEKSFSYVLFCVVVGVAVVRWSPTPPRQYANRSR